MAFHPLTSLRKRSARFLPFPAVTEHSGATFVLDPNNWIDNRLVAGVPFEVDQLTLAERIICTQAIDTFIDIGANIGLYTVLLGRLAQIERVISFEPVRRNYNQLLGNVFANRLDAKVDAHRIALSDCEGEATIHVDPRSTGVSRLDLNGCGRKLSVYTENETIALRRFDDVCRLENRRIYVKIDVEGHTLEALAGMPSFFERNTVYGQVEATDSDLSGITEALCNYGLQQTAAIQGDHFFAPRNG